MSKTDEQLKEEVEEEISWDPNVSSADIRVMVKNGLVSLVGTVDTDAEKRATEAAARRVSGIAKLTQDLSVNLVPEHTQTDAEIASTIQSALRWDVMVPNTVTVNVSNGAVTLAGMVRWNFEREAAERAVRNLTGVVSVVDAIELRPQVSAALVKEKIEAALVRQARADSRDIRIETSGGKVTLTGHASSWQTREDAADAAWAAPGVTEVVAKIDVSS